MNLRFTAYTDFSVLRLLPYFDIWFSQGFLNFGWLFWDFTIDWD